MPMTPDLRRRLALAVRRADSAALLDACLGEQTYPAWRLSDRTREASRQLATLAPGYSPSWRVMGAS